MRSSMRRSTPAIGDGVQASSAACTATRRVKSALSSIMRTRSKSSCGCGAHAKSGGEVNASPHRRPAAGPHRAGKGSSHGELTANGSPRLYGRSGLRRPRRRAKRSRMALQEGLEAGERACRQLVLGDVATALEDGKLRLRQRARQSAPDAEGNYPVLSAPEQKRRLVDGRVGGG